MSARQCQNICGGSELSNANSLAKTLAKGVHPALCVPGTSKLQSQREGVRCRRLTVYDSRCGPQIARHRFDPQATSRLPGPRCLDAHSGRTDVFCRGSLTEHMLVSIGEPHFHPLATPILFSTTVHGSDNLGDGRGKFVAEGLSNSPRLTVRSESFTLRPWAGRAKRVNLVIALG